MPVYILSWSYNLRKIIVYFLFQDRLLPVKIVSFMCDPEIVILFITDCLIFDGQHIITELFFKKTFITESYYVRIVLWPNSDNTDFPITFCIITELY